MPSDDFEGAGIVFGQGLWPIGWSVGFIERDFQDVRDAVARWGDTSREVSPHPDEGLGQLLARLPPLESTPSHRELLVGTQSGWTAYFDNSLVGGYPFEWTAYLARDLRCRGVTAAHIPADQHRYPATSLAIYSPDGEHPFTPLRRVSVGVHSDGEWHLTATGEIQPFERPEMYDAPAIRDRLTREALLEYLLAMGIRADDAGWYRGGVLYERPLPPRPVRRPRILTIKGARRHHAHVERRPRRREDQLAPLPLVEEEADPTTIRHLSRTGVGPGWRCLVVGDGAGSIVRWLADRVGPTGSVVAADMDPTFLGDLDLPNVEVCRLDEVEDNPAGTFLLVHSRLLLMDTDDLPSHVVSRMYGKVRDDGGWLVMEEPDYGCVEATDDTHELSAPFNAAIRKWVQSVTDSGVMDLRIGRSLPALVASESLVDFGNEATTREVFGGRPLSLMWGKAWERVNDQLAAEGAMTEVEIAILRQAFEDPTFFYREPLIQAVWTRRPERG